MQTHLEALRRQEITFDQFARRTATDWTRLAGKLYMAWRKNLPVGVELDDIRQEMLVHAWQAVGKYDNQRGGMSLKRYVVCVAWLKAVRFVHEQRNAKRRDDKSESRHPVSFSELVKESQEDWTEVLLSVSDNTEDLIDARARYDRALHKADGVNLYALVALRMSAGDIPAAGDILFDDAALRLKARWGSPRAAVKQIETTVRACCAA